MKFLLSSLAIVIILFHPNISYSQTYNIKQISGLMGLSQSSVNSICVDDVGYIWLATDFGLNKYDGRSIKKYFWEIDDPNSLSGDYINLIHQDKDNNIWVSTINGLCLYDRENDNFIRNPLNITREQTIIRNSLHIKEDLPIISIYENEDEIWFPDFNYDIYIYNKRNKNVSKLKMIPSFTKYPPLINVMDIVKLDESSLLLLVEKIGILRLDINTGKLDIFLELESVHYTAIKKIDNYFYASTYNDVIKFDSYGKIVKSLSSTNQFDEPHIYLDIKENPWDETIWISSDYGGVFLVDKNLKLLNKLEAGQEINQILPENSIKKIHFIDSKTVVLGTVRCGAIMLYDSGIGHHQYNKKISTGPSDKSVLCFLEDGDHRMWIGTDGGGINLYDRKTNRFNHYSSDDVQIVTSILDYSADELLLASYQKGLYFFNKQTHTFRTVENHSLFKRINKEIRHKIFKDSENNIWISDGSIVKINLEKGTFERFNSKSNPKIFDGLYPIYFSAFESESGKIWFTTVGGLFSYSLKENRFIDKIEISDYNHLYGTEVYSIVEDKFGNIIFGTNKALLFYNPQSGQLDEYISGSIKMKKMFSSLYLDLRNQLWIGTNDQLMKVVKTNPNVEVSVYSSLIPGGSIDYRHNAVLRSFDGNLYMGSNEGITYFVPENIDFNQSNIETVITNFSITGNKKGEVQDSTIVVDLKKNKKITLKYTTGTYQFNFNSFNNPFEDFTRYSYSLENFEEIWHTGKDNSATYTNLPAGKYTFKVKSTNNTGQWSNNTTDLSINILPPWYETIWFMLIMIIITFAIILLVWRETVIRLKLKHKLELEQSEQEQLRAMNQQKLSFFTNISHEIKTPLTLIYSPLKYLSSNKVTDIEVRQALPSLYRNARRMIDLIEQLLEFRKTETSSLSLNITSVECLSICKETIEYFDYYTKVQGIKVVLKSDCEELTMNLDKDKFIKILTNLISNAIKFSKSGDTVCVCVNHINDRVQFEVKDCGIGISQKDLDKIFDRYFQVENGVKGTGIGLSLTKHLVELQGGDIKVESNMSTGTSFKITFPIKDRLKNLSENNSKSKSHLFTPDNNNEKKFIAKIDTSKEFKILVVEDEPELRQYIQNELSKIYIVSIAENGKEGFSAAINAMPDLIISDVMMPEVNGIELCKNIKNDIRLCHIPFILLTAKSLNEDKAEGYISGADAYIPKPFDIELLKLQIAAIIRNRQLQRKRFESDPEVLPSSITNNDLDQIFLEKAIKVVEDNIENSDFKVSHFVNEMGMSRTLVYSKISAIAGKPVKDFILNIRIQKAAKIITRTNKTISETAVECGFLDPSYFSTVFKRYYNLSPLQYRKIYLEASLKSNNHSGSS